MGTSSIMNIFKAADDDWDVYEKPANKTKREVVLPFSLFDFIASMDDLFDNSETDLAYGMGRAGRKLESFFTDIVDSYSKGATKAKEEAEIAKLRIQPKHYDRSAEMREHFGMMLATKKLKGQVIDSAWEHKLSRILRSPQVLCEDDVPFLISLPKVYRRHIHLEETFAECPEFPRDVAPLYSRLNNCMPMQDAQSADLLSSKKSRTLLFKTSDGYPVAVEVRTYMSNQSTMSLVNLITTTPIPIRLLGKFHTRELVSGYRYLVCRDAQFEWDTDPHKDSRFERT